MSRSDDDPPGRPLRVLALDHYNDQDLQALEAHPALALRRIPFQRLRRPAIRMMGEAAGPASFAAIEGPEFAEGRRRYAGWLAHELPKIYLEDPFDVIVLPSDAFFYVRALPGIAHSLGIPVVVVQKETTISPETMENFGATLARDAPFISDWMTVASERQRQFELRAGTDPSRITVTGQPRFDVYWHADSPRQAGVRTVLFFTYALDAYVPPPEQPLVPEEWKELREQTEGVLADLARRDAVRVVVKPHPQQPRQGEVERLRAVAGAAWNRSFVLADAEADTRRLLLDADLVVGFQSTVLYEAVAARRPVVYAAWGRAWERRLPQLLPFHAAPRDCIHHAQSPDALRTLLCSELPPPGPDARPWFEDALGRVDGQASARVVDVLTRVAARTPATAEPPAVLRRRRRFAAGLLVRSATLEAFWTAARPAAAVLGRSLGVKARQRDAREHRRLAVRGLREGSRLPSRLPVGPGA